MNEDRESGTHTKLINYELFFISFPAHFQARDTMRNGSATFRFDDVSYTLSPSLLFSISSSSFCSSYKLPWVFKERIYDTI